MSLPEFCRLPRETVGFHYQVFSQEMERIYNSAHEKARNCFALGLVFVHLHSPFASTVLRTVGDIWEEAEKGAVTLFLERGIPFYEEHFDHLLGIQSMEEVLPGVQEKIREHYGMPLDPDAIKGGDRGGSGLFHDLVSSLMEEGWSQKDAWKAGLAAMGGVVISFSPEGENVFIDLTGDQPRFLDSQEAEKSFTLLSFLGDIAGGDSHSSKDVSTSQESGNFQQAGAAIETVIDPPLQGLELIQGVSDSGTGHTTYKGEGYFLRGVENGYTDEVLARELAVFRASLQGAGVNPDRAAELIRPVQIDGETFIISPEFTTLEQLETGGFQPTAGFFKRMLLDAQAMVENGVIGSKAIGPDNTALVNINGEIRFVFLDPEETEIIMDMSQIEAHKEVIQNLIADLAEEYGISFEEITASQPDFQSGDISSLSGLNLPDGAASYPEPELIPYNGPRIEEIMAVAENDLNNGGDLDDIMAWMDAEISEAESFDDLDQPIHTVGKNFNYPWAKSQISELTPEDQMKLDFYKSLYKSLQTRLIQVSPEEWVEKNFLTLHLENGNLLTIQEQGLQQDLIRTITQEISGSRTYSEALLKATRAFDKWQGSKNLGMALNKEKFLIEMLSGETMGTLLPEISSAEGLTYFQAIKGQSEVVTLNLNSVDDLLRVLDDLAEQGMVLQLDDVRMVVEQDGKMVWNQNFFRVSPDGNLGIPEGAILTTADDAVSNVEIVRRGFPSVYLEDLLAKRAGFNFAGKTEEVALIESFLPDAELLCLKYNPDAWWQFVGSKGKTQIPVLQGIKIESLDQVKKIIGDLEEVEQSAVPSAFVAGIETIGSTEGSTYPVLFSTGDEQVIIYLENGVNPTVDTLKKAVALQYSDEVAETLFALTAGEKALQVAGALAGYGFKGIAVIGTGVAVYYETTAALDLGSFVEVRNSHFCFPQSADGTVNKDLVKELTSLGAEKMLPFYCLTRPASDGMRSIETIMNRRMNVRSDLTGQEIDSATAFISLDKTEIQSLPGVISPAMDRIETGVIISAQREDGVVNQIAYFNPQNGEYMIVVKNEDNEWEVLDGDPVHYDVVIQTPSGRDISVTMEITFGNQVCDIDTTREIKTSEVHTPIEVSIKN